MFNRNPKKNTRFAIYAGNPGFSGGYLLRFYRVCQSTVAQRAYDAAYAVSCPTAGYTAIVVREA